MAKKKGREATAGCDALPPEIWSQILSKLPAKSVLHCRRVCKTWYSLITCPIFVSDHNTTTTTTTTTNRVLLNRYDTTTSRYTLSFHDESFLESPGSTLPLPDGGMGIIGSCNGLVCFHRRDHASDYRPDGTYDMLDTFLIWNPTIGKYIYPPLRFSVTDEVYYILGFGFDPVTDDYKILRIGYPVFYESDSDSEDVQRVEFDDLVDNVAPLVSEIFDLRKGVWRSLTPPVQQFYVEEPCLSVYLHGHLHWIRNERFLNCTMLSFNLSSELFREMWVPGAGEQPDEDDGGEDHFQDGDLVGYTKIFPINGLLSVAVAVARKEPRGDLCTVWSMKEYGVTESWTKLFCVDVPLGQPYLDRWVNLLQFWEDGRVLMVKHINKDCRVVVLYNPKSKESKVLLSTNERILDVCFYSETLVLL